MSLTPEQHERLIRIDERTAALCKRASDHEDRLRSLEKWRSWMVGAAAMAGGATSYLKTFFFGHHS